MLGKLHGVHLTIKPIKYQYEMLVLFLSQLQTEVYEKSNILILFF